MEFKDMARHRRYVSKVILSQIAYETELRDRLTKNPPFNENIFNSGIEWYNNGMTLDDASYELKDNINFVRGYELASRQDRINKSFEIQGAEWYFSGKALEEAIERYSSNEHFIKGYNDAKNSKKCR